MTIQHYTNRQTPSLTKAAAVRIQAAIASAVFTLLCTCAPASVVELPDSLAGSTILFTEGVGRLMITTDTGALYSIKAIGHGADSNGSYKWTKTGTNSATLEMDSPQTGKSVLQLTFDYMNSGSFTRTNLTTGGEEYGLCEIFTSHAAYSMRGVTAHMAIEDGHFPFAGQGEFTFAPAITGNGYRLVNIWGTTGSSGTYTYGWANRSTGRINLQDAYIGASSGYFFFDSPMSGQYIIRMGDSGHFQVGGFQAQDQASPTTTITGPASASRVAAGPLTARGTAADNIGVQRVYVRINSGGFELAEGTTAWSLSLAAVAGTNTIQAYAVDYSGQVSSTRTITFYGVAKDVLTIDTTGSGVVTPAYNGQMLEIGTRYRVTATPRAGQLFAGWTGGTNAAGPVLDFIMRSNLVLRANFISNPFPARKGTYYGLVYSGPEAGHLQSGYITLAVTGLGAYSGKIVYGGVPYSFSGKLDPTCTAQKSVTRLTSSALLANFSVSDAGQVTGTVSDGGFNSELVANRALPYTVYNRCPGWGAYTVVFPGGPESTPEPVGHGYATVYLNLYGVVRMVGSLADGTPISQVTAVSGDATWPLFASAYGGGGSVLGWIKLTETVTGDALWTKPAQPVAKIHRAGLTNSLAVAGSYFSPVIGSVQPSPGAISFTAGNLTSPFTNTFILSSTYRMQNTSPNPLVGSISKANGFFTGSVTVPGTTRVQAFKGVTIQKLGNCYGYGYFLGTNQSGIVEVLPQ